LNPPTYSSTNSAIVCRSVCASPASCSCSSGAAVLAIPAGVLADTTVKEADQAIAQLRKADQQPALLALADVVRAQRSIPAPEARDPLSRYQNMLDNEFYRALKALREAQDWRQRTLEADQDDAEAALDELAAA
jgi:hypothetical protein